MLGAENTILLYYNM